MSYVTVYEISHESFLLSWRFPFIVFPIIFGLFAAIFLLQTRNLGCVTKLVRTGVLLFACLWAVFTAYRFHDYGRYVQAYEHGTYNLIEGRVERYSWIGKTECFTVRGVEFCRGTGNAGLLGWPIGLTREGLPVRIAYSDDPFRKILRLEAGRKSQ